MSTPTTIPTNPSKALVIALWITQALVFAFFVAVGAVKLFTPMQQLASMMPWPGQYPEAFVRIIGIIDIAGGLGILLPSLTRIKPGLTVLAALGCAVLQIFAAVFHISRGEASLTPTNFVLFALCAFVLWGRRSKAPIRPRYS
jgi:uncharacterized membrane protein